MLSQSTPPATEQLLGNSSGENTALNLRFYWNVLKKRWWIILGVVIVSVAGAVVMAARKPKIYQATATVIIDPTAPNALGAQNVDVVQLGAGNNWITTEYYNTQRDILTSRELSRATVIKHQLHRDPRIIPTPPPGVSEEELIDEVAGRLMSQIVVTPGRESRKFAISVLDTNPELARDLANHLTDVYIQRNVSNKQSKTRDAKVLVAEFLDDARRDLDKSETALYSFKKDNNILSVSLEDRQNRLSRDLETFSVALTETKKKRIELEARRRSLLRLISEDPLKAPATQHEELEKLRATYLEERRKLRVMEDRYDEKWPELIAQRQRTDTALADLQGEVRSMVAALDSDVSSLAETEQRYTNEVDLRTQEALELNKKEIAYKKLTRDAKNAEDLYNKLLLRLNESGMQEEDAGNNISKLDDARLPTAAVAPNVRLSGMLGFGVGLLFALGLAFLIEFLDRSVKTQEDIEGAALAFLGLVPSIEGEINAARGGADLHIMKHPKSTVAECCRVVRTNILFCSPDKPLRTLVITSPNPTEGKTMTVINLGVVMAQSGQRTLLVDTDMRRPRLHKALGVSNENGVSRLVVGETTIEEGVKSTDVPNLFLLPCGPIPPNPAELLQTEKFLALIEKLQEKYDRVIFDSPPILAVTDAAVLSRHVDGTILVVRAGRTTREALLRAKRSITAVNNTITGVVLNDVNLKNPHYASYYNYYQYKYHEPAPSKGGKSG